MLLLIVSLMAVVRLFAREEIPLREDGQPPPVEPEVVAADPAIFKDGKCVNSKGPARTKGRLGICGNISQSRIGKDNPVASRFHNANLTGIQMTFSSMTRISFDSSRMDHADLREMSVTRSTFKDVSCLSCDLTGILLRSCDLSGAHFEKSSFRGARLQNTSFRGANLAGADFRAATLAFSDLRETDLRGADLRETVLLGTRFEDARMDESTRLPFSREEAARRGMKGTDP